jgi:hypothetical protein
MSYGIEIRNNADRIILDNTPFHTLEVVSSGWVAAGTSISKLENMTNYQVFVTPHTLGSGMYLYPQQSSTLVCVGGLDYILVKSMKNSTVSGYGLAIFDNQGATNLVFSDNKGFAIFRKSILLSATGVIGSVQTITGLGASSAGRRKYININALYNVASTNVHVWSQSFAFNATETTISVTNIDSQVAGGFYWNRPPYLNIIEA